MIVELVAGALLGAMFVVCVRKLGAELRLYALGLIIAAVIYLGFALIGAAEPRWTAIELAGIVPFAVFAWLGVRRSAWWLAAGWGMHATWDLGLHYFTGTPPFVPAWYPVVCLGFDVFVAGTIALRARTYKPLAAAAALGTTR